MQKKNKPKGKRRGKEKRKDSKCFLTPAERLMFANELVESEKFSETDGGKEVVEKAGGTGV